MSKIEKFAEESGMTQYVAANNKCLERFAKMLIDEVCEGIIESDPSEKMIMHEPYITVLQNVMERFNELYYK